MSIDLPTIGDIVMSPHDKVLTDAGANKYDLLLCDGSTISAVTYPLLTAEPGGTTLPNIPSLDARIPYKIVGDLT